MTLVPQDDIGTVLSDGTAGGKFDLDDVKV